MDNSFLLNELGAAVYVSDPDTYEVLFANQFMLDAFGLSEYKGRICYEMFQGRDTPCDFCTNHLINRDEYYAWEYNNPKTGQHFLLRDKLIDWDGRPARIELALNVTERENQSKQVIQKLKIEQTLVECIRLLISAENLEAAMKAVLTSIGQFYQADRAYILEFDEERTTASNTYEWCAPGVEPQRNILQHVELSAIPFWQQRTQLQDLVIIRDVERLRDIFLVEYERLKLQGIRNMIAAPFLMQNQTFGYVGVDNPAYDSDDADLLQSVSYFVVNELIKRRMRNELEYRGSHDALTGLYNRFRYLNAIGSADQLNLASVGVVFCDINGLKQINDTYGHSAGDEAILRTAKVLRAAFPKEQVFRLSGDEFFVLCENCTESDFSNMVDAAKTLFSKERNKGVSMGQIWTDQHIDLAALARRADRLMYESKQQYYQSCANLRGK